MNTDNRLLRFILTSPWSLCIFLVIPALTIMSVKFHVRLPVANPVQLLTGNNICFAFFAAVRAVWYIFRMKSAIRYPRSSGRPDDSVALRIPQSAAQQILNNNGYTFSPDGSYGEKKDFGYLGSTLFYIGLFVLLSVGIWDNLHQFSGTLLDGMGPATKLSRIQSYKRTNKGLFSAKLDSLPQLIITRQTFPGDNLPKGATDVSLLSEDGKEQKRILIPGHPIRYGDFDISMTRLVFEPHIVIKTKDGKMLFDERVQLDPLVEKRGVYSFYGVFQGYGIGGGVYYNPEKSNLMVVVSRGDKKEVTEMVFQVDQQIAQGEFLISCAKMGQWSELHVLNRRHKGLLLLGGIIMAFGLLARIVIRPRRVWLEGAADGCMVWSSRKETVKGLLLGDEG